MDSRRESPFLASHGYVAIHPDFRNYAGVRRRPRGRGRYQHHRLDRRRPEPGHRRAAIRSALPRRQPHRLVGPLERRPGRPAGHVHRRGYQGLCPVRPDQPRLRRQLQPLDAQPVPMPRRRCQPNTACRKTTPRSTAAFRPAPGSTRSAPRSSSSTAPATPTRPTPGRCGRCNLLPAGGKDITFVSPKGENHLFSDRAWSGRTGVGAQMLAFFPTAWSRGSERPAVSRSG